MLMVVMGMIFDIITVTETVMVVVGWLTDDNGMKYYSVITAIAF